MILPGNNGILLDLYKTGLRDCLTMFLSDFYLVRVGNIFSDHYSQEAGVPQSSILFVTLFSLKIKCIVS